MLGVVRVPSLFSITRTSLPSMMATQEFVVPRSIPITLLMMRLLSADARDPKHRRRPYGGSVRGCMGVRPAGQGARWRLSCAAAARLHQAVVSSLAAPASAAISLGGALATTTI